MLLERAKQRFDAGRGVAEAEARPHLEGALDALDLAYQLIPASWLLFNMAQVQSRLGACAEAAALYQRFLASDPAPEARANAERALELLGSCDAGNEPLFDDTLAPGLFLASGLDSIFEVQSSVARPSAPLAAVAEPESELSAAAVLPWAFGGLAVISGVAGGIYWSEAASAKHDLDRISVAGPEVAQTQQRGESAQNLSRVFGGFAVGFALAAVGSYFWLRPSERETPLAATLERVSVVPLEGGAGAAYQTEF